jgi:hypothetical protein
MYASAIRTDPQLAAQNQLEGWVDCNLRHRPHRWTFEQRIGDHAYFRCTRCPVATLIVTDNDRVLPDRWLGATATDRRA